MFFNLSESVDKYSTAYDAGFTDVNEGDWYFRAINYFAVRHNAIQGFPDGSFRPNEFITNAEFMAFATRYFNLVEISPYSVFDEEFNHWATTYIAHGFDPLWIEYFGQEYVFRPSDPITRAVAITLVNHYTGRLPEPKLILEFLQGRQVYSDITRYSHWAFYEIMLASISHHIWRNGNGDELWHLYALPPSS